MSKPIIAVDIDDVLALHYEALVDFYNRTYDANFTLQDYVTNHWSQVWGTSKEETERRAEAFANSNEHADFLLEEGAQESVASLKQQFDLVIVTARRKQNVEHTYEWLDKHFPETFKHVRFLPIWQTETTETKASICQELGADFLIDDSFSHCEIAAEGGLQVVLFGDYPWNQVERLPKAITRCKDWPAVLEYFDAR